MKKPESVSHWPQGCGLGLESGLSDKAWVGSFRPIHTGNESAFVLNGANELPLKCMEFVHSIGWPIRSRCGYPFRPELGVTLAWFRPGWGVGAESGFRPGLGVGGFLAWV